MNVIHKHTYWKICATTFKPYSSSVNTYSSISEYHEPLKPRWDSSLSSSGHIFRLDRKDLEFRVSDWFGSLMCRELWALAADAGRRSPNGPRAPRRRQFAHNHASSRTCGTGDPSPPTHVLLTLVCLHRWRECFGDLCARVLICFDQVISDSHRG